MSKFNLICSCVNCRVETTVQSLKAHYNKCTTFKNTCKQCNKGTNNPSFCSRSCRAIYVNPRRSKKYIPVEISVQEKNAQKFQEGKIITRSAMRIHLAKVNGYQCAICSLSTWLDNPITLIVDHIDGNAGNNLPDNLRLLCPNCNSQSPTFGGRNKGNGRKARGLPLH